MNTRASLKGIPRTDAYVARQYDFANVEGLSRKALDLHLDLYRGYVTQVNALELKVEEFKHLAKPTESEQLVRAGLVQRRAFELNGLLLHELFFEQLDGRPSGPAPSPGSALMEEMDTEFGGIEGWRNDVSQLAQTRGAGWVLSCQNRETMRLANYWVAEHQLGVPISTQPIAVFDMWEHAYLMDFSPSKRSDYLDVLFRNLDWSVLEQRCLSR